MVGSDKTGIRIQTLNAGPRRKVRLNALLCLLNVLKKDLHNKPTYRNLTQTQRNLTQSFNILN